MIYQKRNIDVKENKVYRILKSWIALATSIFLVCIEKKR
jgi:hypothetical protein